MNHSNLMFVPGFRFHPSDEELIVHYLQNKVSSRPLPAYLIADINLYKYNPWDLPKKALFGEGEWYFFSPRDKKYPNGARPNRAAASGYWKATGTDKPILTSCGSKRIGVKKALVFYSGQPPRGVKTDWIMNEYRLVDTIKTSTFKGSMRLDNWVLCRVKQKGLTAKSTCRDEETNCSKEAMASSVKNEEYLTNKSYQDDHKNITDYIFKDHKLIASLLAKQPLPPMEGMPREGMKGVCTSVHEDDFNKMNSQATVPCLDSHFDFQQGKHTEENWYGDLFSSNLEIQNKNNVPLPSNIVVGTAMNFYGQNQSQHGVFVDNLPDSTLNYQELDDSAYTGKYVK